MKGRIKLKEITILICLSIVFFFFTGCDEVSPVSVEERIEMFLNDLSNQQYSTIRGDHIHPDAPSWDTLNSSYWPANGPWKDYPLSLNSTNVPDTSSVTVNITSSLGTSNYDFVMREEEEDVWKIYSVTGYF